MSGTTTGKLLRAEGAKAAQLGEAQRPPRPTIIRQTKKQK